MRDVEEKDGVFDIGDTTAYRNMSHVDAIERLPDGSKQIKRVDWGCEGRD